MITPRLLPVAPVPARIGGAARLARPRRRKGHCRRGADSASIRTQVRNQWNLLAEATSAGTWACLRRFGIEQQLGRTRPPLRDPAAGRWTWIVTAAWNQPRLAGPLAAAARALTPGRVRAGFRAAR